MTTTFLLEAPIALVPVIAFFLTLLYFDSYGLISPSEVAQTMTAGLALGVAAYFVNGALLAHVNIEFTSYSRFIAPIVEESLKAAALIWLFARNRIGFMIDAAIMGFAIGTGFAVFENVYYLYIFTDANFGMWIIRGFGTAIMHGGVTAIFAVLSQAFIERRGDLNPVYFLPGFLAAGAIHTIYNQFASNPLLATVVILVGLPPLFLLIFSKSERSVSRWLVNDYKSRQRLLDEINNGQFLQSETGRFMMSLSKKFDQSVVDDLFAYLKLHTQLLLRSEQVSLTPGRGDNFVVRIEDKEDVARLNALRKKIGSTAFKALWPHLRFSRRELWQIH